MLSPAPFRDRYQAGKILGETLRTLVSDPEAIVLALPRGGVPVGFEVARALHAGLDIFLVRKLGVPGHEELAMGAIASGGIRVLNQDLVRNLGISETMIDRAILREKLEIERRERLYRQGRPPLPVTGKLAILVDDGLATGATMTAAAMALREERPKQLIVAVPVGSREACQDLEKHADRVICAATPEPFYAVGAWYDDFSQTGDEEVRDLLARAAQARVP